MGGNIRPGSSRVSMFIGDQGAVRIPITEQQRSRMENLAAKAEERNEPGVREGRYEVSQSYMKHIKRESRGSRGSDGGATLRRIPERSIEPKPKPPTAPWLAKATSKENENGEKAEDDPNQCSSQTMKESSLSPASVNSQVSGGHMHESARRSEEGSQVMGFGWYPGATYNEVRNWICSGMINLNEILAGIDMMDTKVVNFLNWTHRVRKAV